MACVDGESLPVHESAADALRAVDDRRVHGVVQAMLRTEPGAEPALADGLNLAPRFYLGPVLLPLTSLRRCCGPEPGMRYPESQDRWVRRVGVMVEMIRTGWEPAPLLYQPALDHLMDGNHRLAALVQAGRTHHPVLLLFGDPDERSAYVASLT
jgi:hypothetical protein